VLQVMIVDEEGNLTWAECEIAVLLNNPLSFPAIKIIPSSDDFHQWEIIHNAMMKEREQKQKLEEGEGD
jgi:hypothetical protein